MSGEDWLWDGQGEPDPDVAALEKALRPMRYEGEPPKLPSRGAGLRARRWVVASIGALAAAAALLFWLRPSGWAVEVVEGSPCADCRFQQGEWLETDEGTTLDVEVADLGVMRVAPGTRIRLQHDDEAEKRLELAIGRIDVSVVAPPRLLVVGTPAGDAVDLGCAYTLVVAPDGSTRIAVTVGRVALEGQGRTSIVIHDTVAGMRHDAGPGLPIRVDASPALVAAVGQYDRGERTEATILAEARPVDTITLWHLLQRVPEADRGRVFGRIVELVPSVLPTDEEAVLRLDPGAVEVLWRDLASTWGDEIR
jgi:hypothetical protein